MLAYEYLVNRSEGNPKASYDLRFTKDSVGLSPEEYRAGGDLMKLVRDEQVRIITELFEALPASSVESNQLVPVQNIWIDIDSNQVEVEFLINEVVERRIL